MLFVLTKSSENYKVMYNALKVGNLTRAIAVGNQQANGYRNAIDEYSVKAETLESELESIKDIDIASAVRLKGGLDCILLVMQVWMVMKLMRKTEKNYWQN